MTHLVLFELFVTNLLLFENKKLGSGRRKHVVNQCLEFACNLVLHCMVYTEREPGWQQFHVAPAM